MKGKMRTGGEILVDQLLVHQVDRVFSVPGESFLAVLDALYDQQDRISVVTTRNEIGACNMAEAFGKLSGRPGICFVTRGPGASHAMVGVHTAFQDSTPLVLFIGQVAQEAREREGFQEFDVKAMFGHTAKWAAEISDVKRIPEMVSHAFHVAVAGRPGPVVLSLPEDMLTARGDVEDVEAYKLVRPAPSTGGLDAFSWLLRSARRPLLMVGGGGWTEAAANRLRTFAENHDLPVCASFRCQDLFDNTHPNYVGDCSLAIMPALVKTVTDADLIIALGPRLGEMTTQGYTLIKPPRPAQKLAHIHASADELGRVYQADVLINSGMEEFLIAADRLSPTGSVDRRRWRDEAREGYVQGRGVTDNPGTLNLGTIVSYLSEKLPDEAVITVDAGNFSGWVNRFYQFKSFRTLIGPTNGAMGYGLPAAIAAKLQHPKRPVVCFAGDGGFLMTGQELATAVQYGANIVVLVVNNGMYGTIRMYQEREYPGRTVGTDLINPDFAAFARSFGAFGETVTETTGFAGAFERALASGRPALLELRLDADAITSRTTLSAIRATSMAAEQQQLHGD